jgi:hypothetical protein
MTRAEITMVDEHGNIYTREVDGASYDDNDLLYVLGDQPYPHREIINMRSHAFCSVRFIHDEPEPVSEYQAIAKAVEVE